MLVVTLGLKNIIIMVNQTVNGLLIIKLNKNLPKVITKRVERRSKWIFDNESGMVYEEKDY